MGIEPNVYFATIRFYITLMTFFQIWTRAEHDVKSDSHYLEQVEDSQEDQPDPPQALIHLITGIIRCGLMTINKGSH